MVDLEGHAMKEDIFSLTLICAGLIILNFVF